MAYEIKEQFAYRKGKVTVALNQVFNREGYDLVSQGFRIFRDGKAIFTAYKPFPTRESAEIRLSEIA